MRWFKRLFVKDYESTEKAEVRFRYGITAGIFGIVTNAVLALQAAFVVGRTGQYVLHAAVHENELVAFRMPGEVLIFAAAAVEAHEAALLAEYGGELVHDAAVAAYVLVLGALAHAGEFHLLDLVVAPEVIERVSVGAFEGCGGGHACAEGHIACKGRVETLDGNAEGHHLAANAEDVACPSSLRTCLVVERKLCVVFQVDGVSAYVARAVGLDFGNHALLYCAGENEAVVVVGMFADEVDAAGRSVNAARFAVKVLDET